MSWDLYLVPAEHADEAHEWLESIVDKPADGAAAAEHAAAIRAEYWDLGERTPELADLVVDVVRHPAGVSRQRLDDPQEDPVVDSTELRETFLGGHAHGIGLLREIAAP